MPHVKGQNIEPEMQSRGTDHKILDCDGNPSGRLLALDSSSESGDCQRNRMHYHVPTEFLSEGCAPDAISFRLGTVDAVCEFDNTHDGQRNFTLVTSVMHAFKNLLDGLAATFAGNEYA